MTIPIQEIELYEDDTLVARMAIPIQKLPEIIKWESGIFVRGPIAGHQYFDTAYCIVNDSYLIV
jgi:hypothetical protein